MFHGKGGYDYETIYNMPIWLRNFTFNKIKEWYLKESGEETEDVVKKSISTLKAAKNDRTITPPTYITKASKK